MEFKKITLLVLPAVLFLIFSSCGNENINSVANTSGTVIFQKDSLSVWLPPADSNSGGDTTFFSCNDVGGVKADFTLQSNADSTHSLGYWGIYTNASPNFTYVPAILGTVDQHFVIDYNFNSVHDTYFCFGLRFYVKGSTVPFYARIKNIKIIKK